MADNHSIYVKSVFEYIKFCWFKPESGLYKFKSCLPTGET